MIPAGKDIYASGCTWQSADTWPPEVAVRSSLALRLDVTCRPMRQNEVIRSVALLGCI